jgi:hypothetical protein
MMYFSNNHRGLALVWQILQDLGTVVNFGSKYYSSKQIITFMMNRQKSLQLFMS